LVRTFSARRHRQDHCVEAAGGYRPCPARADTRKLLLGQGLDAVGNTPDEFAKMYAAEVTRWAKVVKAIDLQPN
jgi:hypothetical protein